MPERQRKLVDHLVELALKEVGANALILLDPEGTIVGWLAGARRMFGYSGDEIIGQIVTKLFVPEDLERGIPLWEQNTAAASGECEDDRWQLRKDGMRIWVSGTLTALHDEQSKLMGFAKVLRNRTDQKLQVEALESRVAACESAAARKNQFIATLAHELRSPLSALANAAELLGDCEEASSDMALAVNVIRRQIDFMARLADDLLEVTRAAIGKAQLKTEDIILQTIVSDAIEACRPSFDKQTQTLKQLMPEVPIHLDGDPVRLRQVFTNLVQNATKYTAFGGTIWVKVTTEGEEAVVRVQDTGVGISPDVMPHIFDLFTQAEFAGQAGEGLGIGLSVVKENVALHGGTIQAASDGLGKGSEFTVRLPLPSAK